MSGPPTHRVLVANRGEIALRVIRAAHACGWEAVAVHSDADADSRWVALADDARHIGPSPARRSYLDIDAVVQAARDSGCTHVHPGYGFLAERPEFARRVTEAGLTFVGPSAEVIESMGDKASARRTAEQAGVPVVPGSEVVADVAAARAAAADVGFPLLIKAAAGGGGKGIRVVRTEDELEGAVSTAQAEASAAFGDGSLYLERCIEDARHIEVQVVGDSHGNVVHFFERDCSVQRRRQKLLEEAPAPGLSPALRDEITDAAVRLAAEVGYQGAGTVEFLVEGERFYFIEMNTRIQVEHPITEMVTSADLVVEQLRVAAGEPLSVAQEDIVLSGAALEFRINAEDPEQDFFPSPGELTRFDPPTGPGVRVDSGFVAGGQIVPYYDSLVAKVIVHGRDREEALARAEQALTELTVDGVVTTRGLHLSLLADEEFRRGGVTTTWFEERSAAPAGSTPD
ncbi:acetyl-CoA carboxylase biotin carboxylase subunit [Janibacter sp. DB-40]|uniref:acetyl-CoA carboxylase biotin carboxylase subunit n=1 Tax=Janibacter sp. DB-40 TaxID=3028808 RepID=UPI002406089F|nr:acetyl-CoA carboxylase biotin carboxylase subunit [Janibacter sp. DB-40]